MLDKPSMQILPMFKKLVFSTQKSMVLKPWSKTKLTQDLELKPCQTNFSRCLNYKRTHKKIYWSPWTGWNRKQSQMLCLTAPPWVVKLNWRLKCILLEFCHFANHSLKYSLSKRKKKIGFWSACIERATTLCTLTCAIPLLLNAGTLSCWMSPLARFAPP